MANSRQDRATVAQRPAAHRVAMLVLEGVVLLDMAVPLQVFGPWPPDLPPGRRQYELELASPTATVELSRWTTTVRLRPLSALCYADTVVVPGRLDPTQPTPPDALTELARAAERGARVVSICTGAFTLAAAGLLDGRRVTTHWAWAERLQRDFPNAEVDARALYVEDGNIISSAGILAGVDVCLHLLRHDLGAEVANAYARFLVSPPHRAGGQAQFIERPVPSTGDGLARTREWLLGNLERTPSLAQIAEHAGLSRRSLCRKWRQETGTSPHDWLLQQRLERARLLLETTALPVPRVAREAGFATPESMRAHFRRVFGVSPTAYRGTFGHGERGPHSP